MTCKICAHGFKKGTDTYECRRYPPTRSRTDRFSEMGDFPTVNESQKCGEFAEKPQPAPEATQEKPSTTKRRKNEPAASA